MRREGRINSSPKQNQGSGRVRSLSYASLAPPLTQNFRLASGRRLEITKALSTTLVGGGHLIVTVESLC